MNTESPRSLIIDSEVLDQPQSWIVYHWGLEYSGEVVFAEVVDTALGLPLRGDASFRLVFFSVPRRIPSGLIQDPYIAMVVPRHSPERMRRGIGGEMRAVRETRERYRIARDPAAAPHRDAEKVIGAVEDALREYNRRLGSEEVRQVLADAGRDRLAKFIGLVHVADPQLWLTCSMTMSSISCAGS